VILMSDELAIIKVRLYVPEGQIYRPNDGPESRLLESFYKLYKKLTPNPDERESKKQIVAVAMGKLDRDEGISEIYSAVNDNSKLVGYRAFDTITMGPKEEGAFGASWYIGIDPDERRHGYGSKLANATVDKMKEFAASKGRILNFVHEEMDDPARMSSEQIEKRRKPEDIYDMIRWASKDYMEVVVDGRRDWFIQPRLDEKSEPVYHLISAMLPLNPELQRDKEMSGDKFLKTFLWKYVYRGYKGIPGSILNDRRDPDKDESYKEMKRKIELAGKVKLVPIER
jgi:ribosomal protein S18 acetylase RimI-like enzyme